MGMRCDVCNKVQRKGEKLILVTSKSTSLRYIVCAKCFKEHEKEFEKEGEIE